MKSLEIVNNTIVKQQTIEIKGTDRLPSIFVDDIRIAGVKWNDSPNVGYITAKLNIHSRVISVENLETIKQDLEVLEILKKYLYIVEKQIPRTDDYFEILESDLDEMKDDENCDDFHKVKQWLEDNENELGK